MKARNIIGETLALIGLNAAVCIQDGSNHEILIRIAGIAMLTAGAFIAKAFDFQNKKS